MYLCLSQVYQQPWALVWFGFRLYLWRVRNWRRWGWKWIWKRILWFWMSNGGAWCRAPIFQEYVLVKIVFRFLKPLSLKNNITFMIYCARLFQFQLFLYFRAKHACTVLREIIPSEWAVEKQQNFEEVFFDERECWRMNNYYSCACVFFFWLVKSRATREERLVREPTNASSLFCNNNISCYPYHVEGKLQPCRDTIRVILIIYASLS